MKFISVEEGAGTGKQKEQEAVIYAKISDRLGLEQAVSVEHQIQAQIKTPVGSIRVRRTAVGSQFGKRTAPTETRYEQTTKVIDPSTQLRTMVEDTETITERLFNQFLGVAPSYMNKTRYKFNVEKVTVSSQDSDTTIEVAGLVFEVDVFMKADNTISEWCKIDVEVQNLNAALKGTPFENSNVKLVLGISKLPFKPTDYVVEGEDGNEDKRKLITALYDSEFLIKNPALLEVK